MHLILTDDLGDAKNTISELTRRYHELEIELRRLENERDELTAAYKEAEAVNISWQIVFGFVTPILMCFFIFVGIFFFSLFFSHSIYPVEIGS